MKIDLHLPGTPGPQPYVIPDDVIRGFVAPLLQNRAWKGRPPAMLMLQTLKFRKKALQAAKRVERKVRPPAAAASAAASPAQPAS